MLVKIQALLATLLMAIGTIGCYANGKQYIGGCIA